MELVIIMGDWLINFVGYLRNNMEYVLVFSVIGSVY